MASVDQDQKMADMRTKVREGLQAIKACEEAGVSPVVLLPELIDLCRQEGIAVPGMFGG